MKKMKERAQLDEQKYEGEDRDYMWLKSQWVKVTQQLIGGCVASLHFN